ncbi:protein kinase [Acidobacteria bacterium AH-259-O06]|nr:protein kinase [Acidobacteria bacterium AH-259-O06]
MVGKTISHYRIIEKLGEGGMGEVYRAEDTTLKREVAIKVLPEQFTQDPQRLARFEREAQLLASLNHPNIAAIYSFEHADGLHFLVLELVEGETLGERIRRSAIPLEAASKIALQIAEALEAAHEKGIIHRDLKPANVKITPEGTVKVLDFGLAKALEDEVTPEDISDSPTLSQLATRTGIILGTAAYMSPEQAKGQPVDKRTDIWAFGCVVYECLVGRQVFGGETVTEILAAILKDEPDWKELPESTPGMIQFCLRRCFQKDLHHRLQHIGDARIAIDEALKQPTTVSPNEVATAAQPARLKLAIPSGIALMIAVIVGVSIWSLTRPSPPAPRALTRVVVSLPPNQHLEVKGSSSPIVLSPDGTRLVYAAQGGGRTQLYLRALDQFEAIPIPGTEGANTPFFSPDGQWVGFFAAGRLQKVSVAGGAPLPICDAQSASFGATWGPDDSILFASTGASGLSRISASGGTPQIVTVPDSIPLVEGSLRYSESEIEHRWPEILPGGKAVLFTIWTGGTYDEARIGVLSLETGQWRTVWEGGTYPRYSPTGHLIYVRSGTLMAVPFDLTKLEVTEDPVPVLGGVAVRGSGVPYFAFSRDGMLAYLPATKTLDSSLVWVDRKGTEHLLTQEKRDFSGPRISPDGKRLAVTLLDGVRRNIWIYEITRGILTPFTFEAQNARPLWTPDGKRLTFRSDRTGPWNIYWMPADGSGEAEQLTTGEDGQIPTSWSPDGALAYSEGSPSQSDIWILPIDGERKPHSFLTTEFNERHPMFSPDGRWIAFTSDRSGQDEIYVKPYPGEGGIVPISTDGGSEPVWARSGKELFYRNGDKMMVVSIQTEPIFKAQRPKLLFEGSYSYADISRTSSYDVAPDGQRFVMVKSNEEERSPTQINVVLNWFEELNRLTATGE